MEGLELKAFNGVFSGRSVLVTGDSGFKGSWLAMWLQTLGAQVSGLALEPDSMPNHSDLLKLEIQKFRGEIGDEQWVRACLMAAQPEIVFHLAAQPLVRRSYRDPVQTWNTNVMGTVNLLEACRQQLSVRAIVLITTDKVYKNQEWAWGYRESDAVGGHDPYSASKACCELVIDSYRAAFFKCKTPEVQLASVRAGNVIGGGDWAEDRLIPDIARATASNHPLEIRSPCATRPWQHVLECLAGYLLIGQRLLEGDESCATAWNIGPDANDNRQVIEILQAMQKHWPEVAWRITSTPQPHEANLLYLDSAKAKTKLGWHPVWDLPTALEKTAEWYRAYTDSQQVISREQLSEYVDAATRAKACWAA